MREFLKKQAIAFLALVIGAGAWIRLLQVPSDEQGASGLSDQPSKSRVESFLETARPVYFERSKSVGGVISVEESILRETRILSVHPVALHIPGNENAAAKGVLIYFTDANLQGRFGLDPGEKEGGSGYLDLDEVGTLVEVLDTVIGRGYSGVDEVTFVSRSGFSARASTSWKNEPEINLSAKKARYALPVKGNAMREFHKQLREAVNYLKQL